MLENAMAARGRPTKILTQNDLLTLQQFLENLPYLKKKQQQALTLLQQPQAPFNQQQLSLLKTVDREKNQFLQRQALIEQIKLKEKNQQPLLANEIEILALLKQDMDQDLFFRLDRALESYQKIEKAALDNRIRLENEHKREILQKGQKQLTEAQKKRNAENQLKYALGGIILSIWKKAEWNIDPDHLESVEHRIKNSLISNSKIQNSQLYQEAFNLTQDHQQARTLFFLALDALPTYKTQQEEFHKALLKKLHKSL